MAPAKRSPGGQTDLGKIGAAIRSGGPGARSVALQDLIDFFSSRVDKQSQPLPLKEKGNPIHTLIEAVFHCALSEKQSYYSGKKNTKASSATRLAKCAEALRTILERAASTLKRKTVRAIIDHITETLPGPEEEFVDPLTQDYIKALKALLDRPAIVELLAALEEEAWLACVDFSIDCILRYLDKGERDSASISRASPAPGTAQTLSLMPSTGRSGASSTQRLTGKLMWKDIEEVLSCLLSLVSASNAPIHLRAKETSVAVIQVLQNRRQSPSGSQQVAFATVSAIFTHIQADDVALASSVARDLIPVLTHWWQARGSSKDALMNSLREEMLKTIYTIRLHLEALIRNPSDESLLRDVEDLLDALWFEYSKREERGRMQLDDLTFSSLSLPVEYPHTATFRLRPYHAPAEQKWALLEVLAMLESLYSETSKGARSPPPDEVHQPRKRRRMAGDSNRLHQKIRSLDPGVRLTALQLIPFLLQEHTLSPQEVSELLDDISPLLSNKQGMIASWAMLACASCAIPLKNQDNSVPNIWKQIWQIAVRSVSLPSTSRAACVLLHTLLESNLIPYHEIADDVNGIVTTADISGPALLVDSSLTLMLHLLYLRNSVLPNASQATAKHIIRWIFVRWNPAELGFASLHSVHAIPFDLVNLLRACCGTSVLNMAAPARVFGGPIYQNWRRQRGNLAVSEYLLLLEKEPTPAGLDFSCTRAFGVDDDQATDTASSHSTRRLVLELFYPKIEELAQMAEPWTKRVSEGGTQVSAERLQSLVSVCISGVLLLPQLTDLNSTMSRDVRTALFNLLEGALKSVLDSGRQRDGLMDNLLVCIAPYIPSLDTAELNTLCKADNRHLLQLFTKFSEALDEKSSRQSSGQNPDLMDVDEDFDSQTSRRSVGAKAADLPRRDVYLDHSPEAFYIQTALRLHFLSIFDNDESQVGLVPATFIDQLLMLPNERLLLCHGLITEVFQSDLVTNADDALRTVQAIGEVVAETEYQFCEIAWCTCVDIMDGFVCLWTDSKLEISVPVGDLYVFLVKQSLPGSWLSPRSQIWISRLLFRLLAVYPTYGNSIEQESCRSTLLSILHNGVMVVKYSIALRLHEIFGLYVLKTHDDIFVDILDKLPADPEVQEGIAFRMFALAELACRWPTLLRRCVYHIFETPGRITQSAKYASRCLRTVSRSLSLETPQELFKLFAPQLLYTWLEADSIDEIPFEIFGYSTLLDLLRQTQTETAAIMWMRGQEKEVFALAEKLGLTPVVMIQQSFPKVLAYSIAHDVSVPTSAQQVTGESRLRKLLGKEPFLEAVYLNFVDVIATFFNRFDQEDPIEKYFRKDDSLADAARIMDEIKNYGHLDAVLPPNQQPTFRAKHLARQIQHLCSRTEYEMHTLWTPALVASVARNLLNGVHPALGPLHACSVLRKIRVLICMAGSHATDSYPLEMLLRSMRRFLVDPECADDALGISKYLITNGTRHLRQVPSFLAGYALSTLADLRVFLESSQSSTTQESQFKATMSKAQVFHSWFSRYLAEYDSSAFMDDAQRAAFKSITQSAAHIRSSGNAEKGTHESNLLLEILKDGEQKNHLLNESARGVALGMLCGTFQIPRSSRLDMIETDQEALEHGTLVWKSCQADRLSPEYLSWAGRVVGRSFAASGDVSQNFLRESQLEQYRKLSSDNSGSEEGLLNLIDNLTASSDCFTAGLAESALRTIVSDAIAAGDNPLLVACQKSLSEGLCFSSDWNPYRTPPSDSLEVEAVPEASIFAADHLETAAFSERLSIYLTQSLPENIVLSVLPPILANVKGFADQAFPFIVHLVLLHQFEKQQGLKRQLSDALKGWFQATSAGSLQNLKLLINTLLYLRTQPLPNEKSIADRATWLDVHFTTAAVVATRCGMFKVALLFAELAFSESSSTSRRSSVAKDVGDSTEVLLSIFEHIDDPDAYYGLSLDSSLSNVVARLEYENDGSKTLAFRGAQYDSHLRRRNPESEQDGQSLVKALSSLGLSGLSNSLLQTQQGLDGSSGSLDSTFSTARRLEIWNLPAPPTHDNHAVTLYKAYQSIHQATDMPTVRKAVYDGLGHTIRHITKQSLNSSASRHHLGALAALTELDDILNVADFNELQNMLTKFETRSKWMMSGRYGDVSQILSCRETSLSLLSQQNLLRSSPNLSPGEARLVQIRAMLLSSNIYRFHHATQESLNLSTSLTDLIEPSEELGLTVDAAIRIEAANSLWDHGEMISSIRMLQSIEKDSTLRKQAVPVSRSDLLSKVGYQVSVARLEGPDNIQKKYLEPALKELKGRSQGKEAGQVYHQFAMFCDQQLQNPDGLEDLARLQNLKKGKSDEVSQLKGLIANTRESQLRQRYNSHLAKAKQWLDLDQQELRRVEQTRNEFVKLSLENYLLSLSASDEHNNDALRFTALWLERSGEDSTNEAVKRHLDSVPTRKLAPLMNQLSSRLQDHSTSFQKLLINLVYRICVDHPYHGMYQIWSGTRTKTNSKDEVAVLRQKATEKIANQLAKTQSVAAIWQAIDKTSRYYHSLAIERDANRYKAGQKVVIKESPAGQNLIAYLAKYPIPPPTLQIELAIDKDYSNVPLISKLEPTMSIASGVSAPKIITAVGSNGQKFKQLVKGGNDDLRQDAIMEQVFSAVSELLKLHRTTRQRNLGIRTYKVLPLTSASGLIEFVSDTIPLHEYLMPAHERYYPKDLKGSQCRKEISQVQGKTVETRISTYRKVTEKFHPVMRYFFMEYFADPDEWFVKRLAYTRTTAAISMLGHVLGLGDRHGHNILLDSKTGEVVHIDLGVAFEMGRVLPVPELVPFRLTRDIIDGMGITGTEGVFRRCCEFTLDALREETYSIMTILDVLRYDPLYSWSISPVRLAKLQDQRRIMAAGSSDDAEAGGADEQSEVDNKRTAGDGTVVNEPSEADRALEVVRKKLSKTLSVTATVNDLINQARDERNLAVLYSGWAAYA